MVDVSDDRYRSLMRLVHVAEGKASAILMRELRGRRPPDPHR
jgi:hypothetical protein